MDNQQYERERAWLVGWLQHHTNMRGLGSTVRGMQILEMRLVEMAEHGGIDLSFQDTGSRLVLPQMTCIDGEVVIPEFRIGRGYENIERVLSEHSLSLDRLFGLPGTAGRDYPVQEISFENLAKEARRLVPSEFDINYTVYDEPGVGDIKTTSTKAVVYALAELLKNSMEALKAQGKSGRYGRIVIKYIKPDNGTPSIEVTDTAQTIDDRVEVNLHNRFGNYHTTKEPEAAYGRGYGIALASALLHKFSEGCLIYSGGDHKGMRITLNS